MIPLDRFTSHRAPGHMTQVKFGHFDYLNRISDVHVCLVSRDTKGIPASSCRRLLSRCGASVIYLTALKNWERLSRCRVFPTPGAALGTQRNQEHEKFAHSIFPRTFQRDAISYTSASFISLLINF
jgi:hypothetical protein